MAKLSVTTIKPGKEWGHTVYEVIKNGKFIGYTKAPNGNRKAGG